MILGYVAIADCLLWLCTVSLTSFYIVGRCKVLFLSCRALTCPGRMSKIDLGAPAVLVMQSVHLLKSAFLSTDTVSTLFYIASAL